MFSSFEIFDHLMYSFSGDLAEGCSANVYVNQYGTFNHSWLKMGSVTDPQHCRYDDSDAIFVCKKDSNGWFYVEKNYYCWDTSKTKKIQKVADDTVITISNDSTT